MAKKLDFVIFLDCCEAGLDRLVVGHTLRVSALCDAYYLLWHFQLLLLYNLVAFDDVYSRVRGDEGKLVEFLVFKELVSNLDDALLAVYLAREVDSYGDLAFYSFQIKDVQCLVYVFSGYMVQYGTILQCAYYQFFSAHDVFFLRHCEGDSPWQSLPVTEKI